VVANLVELSVDNCVIAVGYPVNEGLFIGDFVLI